MSYKDTFAWDSEMHSYCGGTIPWHRSFFLWVEDEVVPSNAYWINAWLWKQIFMGMDWCWQNYSYIIQSGIPCQKPSTASLTLANPSWHFILPFLASFWHFYLAKLDVCFCANKLHIPDIQQRELGVSETGSSPVKGGVSQQSLLACLWISPVQMGIFASWKYLKHLRSVLTWHSFFPRDREQWHNRTGSEGAKIGVFSVCRWVGED